VPASPRELSALGPFKLKDIVLTPFANVRARAAFDDRRPPELLSEGGRRTDPGVGGLAGVAVALHPVAPVPGGGTRVKLIYAANTSLDGYLDDETGSVGVMGLKTSGEVEARSP
jgi:hypothetical protein